MNSPVSLVLLALLLASCQALPVTPRPADGLRHRVIVGYQGWFNAYGDGSPVQQWVHWAQGAYRTNQGPAPGSVRFDLYPDLRDYPPSGIFPTNLGPLGDGRAGGLFSSYRPETTLVHFDWMKSNGIATVALQRFLAPLRDPVFHQNLDAVAEQVRQNAERTSRQFFVMYDISGATGRPDWIQELLADVDDLILGPSGLSQSPAWTQQGARPVISIWGVGFTHTEPDPAVYLDLIKALHERGFFILGGVPTYWKLGTRDSLPNMAPVYTALDGISPWMVGRFGTAEEATTFAATQQRDDLLWCRQRNIVYLPVIWPGFSWGNWQPNSIVNQIRRQAGGFLWSQALGARNNELTSAYVAMFDEYDEGTAIMKAARDSLDIPINQDFLTLSSDGIFVESDFYLRLTGAVGRLLRREIPATPVVPVPTTLGPVWWRTSFETRDAIVGIAPLTLLGVRDATLRVESWGGAGQSGLHLSLEDDQPGTSIAYWKFFESDLEIVPGMKLKYRFRPDSPQGRYVGVDLILADGQGQSHALRDIGLTDSTGTRTHPGEGRGVVGQWTDVEIDLSPLAGQRVRQWLFAYDQTPLNGSASAWLDWVSLEVDS